MADAGILGGESSPGSPDLAARRARLAELVRDALAHLHDPVCLQTHPLVSLLALQPSRASTNPGRALHQLLRDAIDELRPAADRADPHARRVHEILRLRYVEALAPRDVQRALALSRAEYFRDQQRAVAAVAALLQARLPTREPALPASPGPPASLPPPPQPQTGKGKVSLPTPRTSFIGRRRELSEIARILESGRLVTLVGPGGCGKTRLAIEAAHAAQDAYPDGVWFIDLSTLADAALIESVVAAALGLKERPGESVEGNLIDGLSARHLLLLLDNCEHLVDACARLVDHLLDGCPAVRILTTSREPLRLDGEAVVRVPPLATPDLSVLADAAGFLARVSKSEAGSLFVDRAKAARSGFALTRENARAVAEVCDRLDGIPLALELAAARLRALSVEHLGRRLDDQVPALGPGNRDASPRHQTLRGAIDWSYALIAEKERVLLRRLAAFVGRFTVEAAETVCADGDLVAAEIHDLLAQLVDKSFVEPGKGQESDRYVMLEMIRQYARERLGASGEAEVLARRHATCVVDLVEVANLGLRSAEAPRWLGRLNDELGNVRAALRWCVDHDAAANGARLVWALWRFWTMRGHLGEGARWVEELLALPTASPTGPSRARLLGVAGLLAAERGDFAAARSCLEEGIETARSAGDAAALAFALGRLALVLGPDPAGRPLLAESVDLLRASDDRWGLAITLAQQSFAALWQGDEATADAASAESLALLQEVGDVWQAAYPLYNRALLARRQSRAEARTLFEEALARFHAMGEPPIAADSRIELARLLVRDGDPRRAAELLREALDLGRRFGSKQRCLAAVEGLAGVALDLKQPERASRLAGLAEALREVVGARAWPPLGEGDVGSRARLRAQVPDATLAAAWTAGRMMTIDQALAEAGQI